ncbi:hypothetical protein CTM97_00570 [Photobacterium phosphoreum]|uniref:MotA/TolQ/ExbB proton channel domain-containing protein n=1 Tax=Photobacterium phosphoreum TaxID=659 RepID=A0A2T3JKY2_PHOPO|nr:hypothetical protein [Photobacterium phosphoreum]PSU24472.1 hypothetical protein CTM96_12570 [Photobacterium phosphoreum]PSU44392.1 hypothetical protein CTM97_00570 [Photobacterium phosphoreum]PSU49656.1 hypothetical protein C9J18_15680 [Photobacterium phosphoreum]
MNYLENILRGTSADSVSIFIAIIIMSAFIVALILGKMNLGRDFVQYAPTLLTTLGIFGTFFGIVLGLLDFNQANIEESIPPLLAGLKTAFITSLIGIFASLVLKVLSTIPVFQAKKSERMANKATPEDILSAMESQVDEVKALKDALIGNEESTLFGQLKILRGDINDNSKNSRKVIQEQADIEYARFQEQASAEAVRFDEFSDKLWLKMQDFTDAISKSATEQIIDALKQVISDFNHNLTEQFGDNFKQLNEAVLLLVRWQEDYKAQLEEMKKQYELGVEAITSTESSITVISEHSKAIPESMSELKEIMIVCRHQISDLESHLNAFSNMRDKAVEAVPEIQNHIETVVKDISKSVDIANEHYTNMLSETDKGIKNVVQDITKSIDTVNEHYMDILSKTDEGIQSVSDILVGSAEIVNKKIDLASTEFMNNTARTNESLQNSSDYLQEQAGIMKQNLENSVRELNSTMRSMIETLVKDTSEMNSTMTTANQNLVLETSNIRDVISKSVDKLQQRLSDVIDDVATQQINQAKRTFDAMEDQVRNQVGLTGEAVDSQLKLIDESMQQEINRVITEMGRALTQVTGKFVEDYVKLTQAMNEIVNERAA